MQYRQVTQVTSLIEFLRKDLKYQLWLAIF